MVKDFKEYLSKGIVNKKSPDLERMNSLLEESEKRIKFVEKMLDKLGLSDEDANYFVENSYDAIMELIRANMLKVGLSSSGKGSHEAEIAFLKELKFNEEDIIFLDELRYFRNGIVYYGKVFDKEYAKKVIQFLKEISPRLKKLLK